MAVSTHLLTNGSNQVIFKLDGQMGQNIAKKQIETLPKVYVFQTLKKCLMYTVIIFIDKTLVL